MEKQMNDITLKILMVGLGSIGQRHVRNLKKLYGERIVLFAFRQRRKLELYDEGLNVVDGKNIEDEYNIKVFSDFEDALKDKIDIVFISNPTSMHVEYAIKAAEKGCSLFVEKPISDSLEKANQLLTVIEHNKVLATVGYQMRFHPCIKLLKQYITNKAIGQLLYVHCEVGELITDMHKYEDYSQQYIAQKKLGGGVVVNQIHELDYLQWILGMPTEIYSLGGKLSDLNIDVEDCAMSVCKFYYENKTLPVYIQQDMLQKPAKRNCSVIGTLGKIEVDLLKNTISLLMNSGETTEHKFDAFQRNEMFIEELKAFIDCIDNQRQPDITVKEGMKSLQIATAIKESIVMEKLVKIV